MDAPDYETYSLDELYDAHEHIDREAWPDRLAAIEAQIAKREAEPDPKPEPEPAKDDLGGRVEPRSGRRLKLGLIASTVIGLVVVMILVMMLKRVSPGVAEGMAFAASAQQSVAAAYPDDKVEVSLHVDVGDGARTLRVKLVNADLASGSEARKRGAAEEIATTAFASLDDEARGELAAVAVSFPKRIGIGSLHFSSSSETYRFATSALDVDEGEADDEEDEEAEETEPESEDEDSEVE